MSRPCPAPRTSRPIALASAIPAAPASCTAQAVRRASRSGMPIAPTVGSRSKPAVPVAPHRRGLLGGEDDPALAAAVAAVGERRRPAAAADDRGPCRCSSIANSERPQMRSRTSAIATPQTTPLVLGTNAPPGSVVDAGGRCRPSAGAPRLRRHVRGTPLEQRVAARGRRRRRRAVIACARIGRIKQRAPGVTRAELEAGPLPSSRPHGRPQAATVALAHDQAPLEAQDQRADVQRVPAVPQPAAAAPRLPDVRYYARPRGRRAAARTHDHDHDH